MSAPAILLAGPVAGLIAAWLYWRLINAIGNALFGKFDEALAKIEERNADR
jgi:hypothetical protein